MPQRVSKIQTIGNRCGKQLLMGIATVLLSALLCTPTIAGETVSAPFASLQKATRPGEIPVDDRSLAEICGKGTKGDIATKVLTGVILWDEAGGGGTRRRDANQRAEVSVTAQKISFTLSNN